jgi:hypothetical protein
MSMGVRFLDFIPSSSLYMVPGSQPDTVCKLELEIILKRVLKMVMINSPPEPSSASPLTNPSLYKYF